MKTGSKAKPRRPWQEVWPSFANRDSLQDQQDQFDLEQQSPALGRALLTREALLAQKPHREDFSTEEAYEEALGRWQENQGKILALREAEERKK